MPGNQKGKKNSKRVKLIINPEAGDPTDPTRRIEQITRLLMDQGLKVSVALARPKEKAYIIAKKAVKKGFRTIVAMGGDGTVEAVARALIKTKARLGILPGGTENNIITALGIPADLEAACELIRTGEVTKIDVGQVKVKGKKKMYFLELTGVGLIANLFPEANKINKGKIQVFGEAISELINFQTPKFRLKLDDDEPVEMDSLLVTVSNLPSFGKKFLVAPTAELDDGLLDINLYPGMSKTGLAAYLRVVTNGGISDEDHIERYRARRAVISADPDQEIVADSIMLGKGKLKVRARKKALRVIAGHLPTLVETAGLEKQPEKSSAENKQPVEKIDTNKEREKLSEPDRAVRTTQEPLPAPVAPAPNAETQDK